MLAGGALFGFAPVPAVADEIIFDRMEAFYVEQATGRLSANIMPPAQTIDFWNTMIGEGGATGGGGSDVLLVTHFRAVLSEAPSPQIDVTVKEKETGRTLLERKNIYVFYDPEDAKAGVSSFAKAFFLEEVQCTPLVIVVTIHDARLKSEHVAELPFACGE